MANWLCFVFNVGCELIGSAWVVIVPGQNQYTKGCGDPDVLSSQAKYTR